MISDEEFKHISTADCSIPFWGKDLPGGEMFGRVDYMGVRGVC